jgi:16S rRNA (uracil1498-N3)-methyltransferase
MSTPRIHLAAALTAGLTLTLPEAAAHHAARVLRLRVGDGVTLFNGQGGEYAAVITAITRNEVQVALRQHEPVERESPLAVTLVQAISSGERMDLTIQKAVELGVARIVPVESERGVVRLHGERAGKRVAHWQQVVVSACEQCGRNRIPEVRSISPLDAWLAAERGEALRWMLVPGATLPLRDMPEPVLPVELLVGPEGGFTDKEVEAARCAGFQAVRLGPRVLRTETAAPALLAALQALWGDF